MQFPHAVATDHLTFHLPLVTYFKGEKCVWVKRSQDPVFTIFDEAQVLDGAAQSATQRAGGLLAIHRQLLVLEHSSYAEKIRVSENITFFTF